MHKIYFDNGSTSFPKAPGVGEAMMDFICNAGFNINRGGYQDAYKIADTVYDTRMRLCKLFNFEDTKNIVFTPSVTYSLNFLLKGFLKQNDHVIVSSMEHNAVMRPLTQLLDDKVTFSAVPADECGCIDPNDFASYINERTRAIVVTHASNVCGTMLPIKEIGEIAKKNNIRFIVDTAQTAGFVPLDINDINADALAFTGHKGLLGPQGIGGFVITDSFAAEITPIISGGTGSQSNSEVIPSFLPDKFEAGTMNLPGIFGLNAALKYIENIGIDTIHKKEMELTKLFIDGVLNINNIRIVGKTDTQDRVAIVSLDFLNNDNAEVSFWLDSKHDIMTRCGMHCAPRAHKTLKTFPKGTVRFAFGHLNTQKEVEYCLDSLMQANL